MLICFKLLDKNRQVIYGMMETHTVRIICYCGMCFPVPPAWKMSSNII